MPPNLSNSFSFSVTHTNNLIIFIQHILVSISQSWLPATVYSHKLLYQSAWFCSKLSDSDVQKHAWFEIKPIYLHFFFFLIWSFVEVKFRNEAMPSGNFKTESSGPHLCACWKLTEIKLAKKWVEASRDTRGEWRQEREIKESAAGWWWKNAAHWLICF